MHSKVKNRIVLAMGLATLGVAAQQTHSAATANNVEQALRQLERQSVTATLKRDVAFMNDLLTEGYINTTAGGETRNKAQTLAELRTGRMQIRSLDVEDLDVRAYGDSAVMTGISHIRGTNRNRNFRGSGRFTRVFVRTNGRWRLAAQQTTPMSTILHFNTNNDDADDRED